MKIGFTINLGDYQLMKIESSELENLWDCLREVFLALERVENERVEQFKNSSIFEAVRQ